MLSTPSVGGSTVRGPDQVHDQLPGVDARFGLVEAGPWLWALGASGAVALDARTLLTVRRAASVGIDWGVLQLWKSVFEIGRSA